jgi:hypothetical protein
MNYGTEESSGSMQSRNRSTLAWDKASGVEHYGKQPDTCGTSLTSVTQGGILNNTSLVNLHMHKGS